MFFSEALGRLNTFGAEQMAFIYRHFQMGFLDSKCLSCEKKTSFTDKSMHQQTSNLSYPGDVG